MVTLQNAFRLPVSTFAQAQELQRNCTTKPNSQNLASQQRITGGQQGRNETAHLVDLKKTLI